MGNSKKFKDSLADIDVEIASIKNIEDIFWFLQ